MVEESVTEYCTKLESWLWQSYYQRGLAESAYVTALFSQSQLSLPFQEGNGARIRDGVDMLYAEYALMYERGTLYWITLAPLWKRLLAEIIDCLIFFVCRILCAYIIVQHFKFTELEVVAIEMTLYGTVISITWEYVLFEIAHVMVTIFFEAFCLWSIGATTGKKLMNLRVFHVEHVFPEEIQDVLGSDIIIFTTGSLLSFQKALQRSFLKSCLYFCFSDFRDLRTKYDRMCASVVIQLY